ncbi:MAG: hypothetical protein ACKVWV_02950 [Planctomycetota bacterium]
MAIGNPGTTTTGAIELATYDDGGGARLYAGGVFTSAGGSAANGFARWDGASWSPLAGVTLGASTASIRSLLAFDDGSGPSLFATGVFSSAGGVAAHNIARWNGSAWSPLAEGLDGIGMALIAYDDGGGADMYAAGNFIQAGFVFASGIAQWNGSSWSTIGSGVNADGASDISVKALAVYDSGSGDELYAGGNFFSMNGIAASNIARWNGSAWSTFGAGLDGAVLCMATYDDGTGTALYVGGLFTHAGGVAAARIAKWNGSSWSALGTGLSAYPNTLAVWDDGTGAKLYAGGAFNSAGGVTVNRIAAWDGSNWSGVGSGIALPSNPSSALVTALCVFDEGLGHGPELFGSGSFSHAGGLQTQNIARYGACTPIGTPYCFGDGSLATPCACVPPNTVPNPSGAPDAGCANSFHLGGGRLAASGAINPDTVRLLARDLSPAGFGFFIAGSASVSNGVAVGDGVRCADGALVRFGSQNAVGGQMSYPNPLLGWTLAVSAVGGTAPGSALTEHYQVYYRNAAVSFCSSGTANLTNAVRITW